MKHKDEIYTMDVETGKIKVEYDRTIKEESEVGKILKALSTEHFNNHKDLVPGTSEWDLWMHNAMGAYIIMKKGNIKKRIEYMFGKICVHFVGIKIENIF